MTDTRHFLYERDGGLCGFCGKPVDPKHFHVDHIKPRAMGGTAEFSNLRIAHPACNISAGSNARTGFVTRWNGPTKALTISGISHEDIARMYAVATQKERSLNYVAARVIRAGLDELRKNGWLEAKD